MDMFPLCGNPQYGCCKAIIMLPIYGYWLIGEVLETTYVIGFAKSWLTCTIIKQPGTLSAPIPI